MKLSDQTIQTFLHLLQVALLTGTDIIDHFRMLELVADEENLVNLTEESRQALEDNVKKMLQEAETLANEVKSDEE